jgi:hypothetical protein
MQTDLFTITAAAFRDRLLAGEAVEGSDGATWQLGRWGSTGYQFWGFSRQAPGDIVIAFSGSGGLRQHHDRGEAVADLERWLQQHGAAYRARDQESAARRQRVAADIERIKAAIPDGWEWQDYGLGSGSWRIARPYVYGEPRAPLQSVYACDLSRDPNHADRIIAAMDGWTVEQPEAEPPEEAMPAVPAEAETLL